MTFYSPRLKCLLIMLPLQGYYSQYTVAIFNDFGVLAECILTAQNKKNRSKSTHKNSPHSGCGSMGRLGVLHLSKAKDRLLSMQVFERVVSEGGFAAAARALDMSPAVVSRLVGDLEEHLDTRLIQRTTRKFALTESGNVYLQKLKVILQEVSDAAVAAQNSSGVLTGTLHILATPLLASFFLAPLAATWCIKYPQVTLEVSVDPFSYMRVEEFDLTLMLVEADFDADIVARVLGRSKRLCAPLPITSLWQVPQGTQGSLETMPTCGFHGSWHLGTQMGTASVLAQWQKKPIQLSWK
jgi:molybdenum-dependent DNA-binding transcriptional regulator ModE